MRTKQIGYLRVTCAECQEIFTTSVEKDYVTRELIYQECCPECIEREPLFATRIKFYNQ